MPRAKRNTPFQPGHGLFYGLRPVSRDPETNAITSVACRFCEKFGREEKVGAKRRATQHVKHFKQPFRTENYHQHHLGQHPTRWTEYQVLPADRKVAYLAPDAPAPPTQDAYSHIDNLVNTAAPASHSPPIPTPSFQRPFVQLDPSSAQPPIKFLVDRPIVDVIIADVLFDPVTETVPKEQVVAAFTTLHETMSDYIVSINNIRLFNLILQYVAIGATSKLASSLITESTKTSSPVNQIPFLEECSPPKMSAYLRCVCAHNLQAIADIMRSTWGFSVSFHRVTHRPSYYIDVRLRFCVSGSIQSCHLLALPPPERFNWENSHATLVRVLDAMNDKWREKMIGVATDGFELADGVTHILVDRLKNEGTGNVLRTWSAANQLDAVIKSVYASVLDGFFFETLTHLIAYLRRQDSLTSEFKSTCPKLPSASWRCLEQTLTWIRGHRMRIMQYLQEKKPTSAPSLSWWVIAMAVLEFTQAVSKTYHRICGMKTVLARQANELSELVRTLNRISGCKGPVTEDELTLLRDWDLIVDQKFMVQKSAIRNFLSGLGTFVHVTMNELSPPTMDEVVNKVGLLFLSAVVRLSGIILERESGHLGTSRLPPVLPHELVHLTRASFNGNVRKHTGRLAHTMTPAEIEQIEEQFGALTEAYHREEAFQASLIPVAQHESFELAWGQLASRFGRLHLFCGGIATAFPEAHPESGDFSMLPWETNVFRESAKDFALEGSLQCKQHNTLATIIGRLQP